MNISKLILDKVYKKGEVRASDIVRITGFSRAYINRFFQELRDEGKITLIGKANKARYIPSNKQAVLKARKEIKTVHRVLINKNLSEDFILADIKKNSSVFLWIADNVSSIVDYAFSEMLNNAIEHSNSKEIEVVMERSKRSIDFKVIDKGVGIFKNIMRKRNLRNEMEAIQDLLKGKQTTAPKEHSGEGIFFTSKIAEVLTIQSSHKKIIYNNLLNDFFIRDVKNTIGTKVIFYVSLNSEKTLKDIFRKYADDSFEFSKTAVTIKLYKMDSEYISRSQARRILSGLDKFKTIILDFKNVKMIGQGFADEVFRVWKSRHSAITIIPENINENINFMINRACIKK